MVMTKGAVVPEQCRDILAAPAFAHVATIGPHGEPQSNPVWFDWDGRYLRFSQTKTRQKYKNFRRDPRAVRARREVRRDRRAFLGRQLVVEIV